MINNYVDFYKKVKSPSDNENVKKIIKTIKEQGIKALEFYGQIEDNTDYISEDLYHLKEKAIHYTNGQWTILKNDSAKNKLEKTGEISHTFFMNVLKKDVYKILIEYVDKATKNNIPFEIKIIHSNDKSCFVYIYSTDETLIFTANTLEEIQKDIIMGEPFILSGKLNSSLGYMNCAYNIGGKISNDFYEGGMINNIEKSLIDSFVYYYQIYKNIDVELKGKKVKWKTILGCDIAKTIYDEYLKMNRLELDSIYAPQYFGVTGKEFLDKHFLKKLSKSVIQKLDGFFENKNNIKLSNSSYAILNSKKFIQMLCKLDVSFKYGDLSVLEIPFIESFEKNSFNREMDENNICFKKGTKENFESLDEKFIYPEIQYQSNEEYVYYSLWINNNLEKPIIFKGKEITFGDYFVRYVASYLSSIHNENYEKLYKFLLSRKKELISDIRNYGMEKHILEDDQIDFIISKLVKVIEKVYPESEYKKEKVLTI